MHAAAIKRTQSRGARSGLLTQVTAGVALAICAHRGRQPGGSVRTRGPGFAPGIVDADVQLTAAVSSTSLTNCRINLLIDPPTSRTARSRGQQYDRHRDSFTADPGWSQCASNIWGIDPADYARFFGVAASAVPFPAPGADDDMYTATGSPAVREVPGGRDAGGPWAVTPTAASQHPGQPHHRLPRLRPEPLNFLMLSPAPLTCR